MTIAEYLKRYDIDKHIAKIVEVYRKRRNVAIESIERYFPGYYKVYSSRRRIIYMDRTSRRISARDVLVRSLEKRLLLFREAPFIRTETRKIPLRINYSNMPEDKIEKGLKTLGEVVKEYISQSK